MKFFSSTPEAEAPAVALVAEGVCLVCDTENIASAVLCKKCAAGWKAKGRPA